MKNFSPRTATEALRLIRCIEATKSGDFDLFPSGDGIVSLYSWKTNEEGKRVKSFYEVNLTAWNCTCPDFAKHGQFCKHLFFVENVAALQDAEDAQEALLAQMDDDAANCEEAYPW